jgi:hypothetical protein
VAKPDRPRRIHLISRNRPLAVNDCSAKSV